MKTILVIEDFVAVRKYFMETFAHYGYQTIGVENGQKAYETLMNHPSAVNLIITEYHLTDGSGYDFLKRLRSLEDFSRIPVIILSAESNPDTRQMTAALGPITWVDKPFRQNTLMATIEKLLAD